MASDDVLTAKILLYLVHQDCPECGQPFGESHDGDCTRAWNEPGKGLLGDRPPFRGTELLGLRLLVGAILSRMEPTD